MFKVWSKNSKCWIGGLLTIFQDGTIGRYSTNTNGFDILGKEEFEIVKYTGLKDSRGIKIYEGDIVEEIGWEGEYYKIVFHDYGFKLYNLAKGFMPFTSRYKEMYSTIELNVVGNIYESKERLEIN